MKEKDAKTFFKQRFMILSCKDILVLQISLVTEVTKFHILKNQLPNLIKKTKLKYTILNPVTDAYNKLKCSSKS